LAAWRNHWNCRWNWSSWMRDAAVVFAPAQPNYDIDMREWVTFARAAEADRDDGLVFVDAPMTEALR